MDTLRLLPSNLKDKLSFEERQKAVKLYHGCSTNLPEFRSDIDKSVADIRDDIFNEYVKTDVKYEFLAANEEFSMEFLPNMTLHNFPSEYVFMIEEIHRSKVIYRKAIPFMLNYGGVLWDDLLGFMYVLFHQHAPSTKEFLELSKKYSAHSDPSLKQWSKFSGESADDIMVSVNTFLKYLFKDPSKHYVRYMTHHSQEIIKRGGIRFLSPILVEFFNTISPELTENVNEKFISLLKDQEETPRLVNPINVEANIRFPEDRPSVTMNVGVEKPAVMREFISGILTYKVVPDHTSYDSRFGAEEQPYTDSARYDPPITRGVSYADQPHRYVLANSKIDYDDLDGDTMNMRKIVTADMLTKTLDWAAKNNLPAPPVGSEIYLQMGDDAKEDMKDLFIGVYSRKRRFKKRLVPFPDYSYQVFSINSRFHIRESTSMSWGDTKNYIIDTLKTKKIKPSIKNMFFRGNDVCLSGIRKDLWYIQDKYIKAKPPLPAKTLKIEIPKLDAGKEGPPMSIPEMGKYKVLLDLPGYGMWSTRLKFICLTDSHVVRILYYTHTWNPDSNKWDMADKDLDVWETFVDSFLPVEFTHTIYGDRYSYVGLKTPELRESAKKLNIKTKNEMIARLSKLYANIDSAANVAKTNAIKTRARSLTDDHIMEFMYSFIMMQSKYYGFST